MNYTLIGTGNMAYFLAHRLQEMGFECKGVFGRDRSEATEIATVAKSKIFDSIEEVEESDCCIIAVSDHAIAEVSNQLKLKRSVVIHTAGSVSLNAILQENKAVLWPIYSIIKTNLPIHKDFPIVCDFNNEIAKNMVMNVASALSDNVSQADDEKRKWMHLIAAMGNNFINHIMTIIENLCKENNISFDIFKPILQQTFHNIEANSPYELQSGAAKRNDEKTMKNHVALLSVNPYWENIYKVLSASIEDMYNKKTE